MPVFEFSLSRPVAAARRRRSHLVSWLVGTMPKVWMHQKLWRKFAIIEVALAFYCAWDGAWESINSVQQNAPGRSTVVNISHHHHFPKQQLQRRKPTSTKKTDTAIVVKSFTSSQEAQRVPRKYMKPVDEPQQKIINFFFKKQENTGTKTNILARNYQEFDV